jgi:spermidine synthase
MIKITNKILLEVAFLITTLIAGLNLQLNWFAEIWDPAKFVNIREFAHSYAWSVHGMVWRPVIGMVFTPLFFYGLRLLFRFTLSNFKVFKNSIETFCKYDSIAYLPLLLTCSGYFGIQINFFLIFMMFFVIQSYLIFKIYAEHNNVDMNTNQVKNNRLFVLFFISGFAALIYQVVWQRALFQFFGVNIESVTVIVSVFMLGLGLGALIGGYLSKRFPNQLTHLFVFCEGLIGVFGFFSLNLFNCLNNLTLHSSSFVIALTIYGVLALPTICMGATLPLLIQYFHNTIKNVGKTVSFLYFINTLGSAFASFFTVEVLFFYFGMHVSTIFASICNLTVALLGALFIKQNIYTAAPTAGINKEISEPDHETSKIRFYLILFLACIVGYIAMSQEILWIRFLSFATGGESDVFAKLVGSILFGIALGAITASWICERVGHKLLSVIAFCLIIASLIYFTSIPLLSYTITKISSEQAIIMMYLFSGIISFLMGITLPVLSHYAVSSYSHVGLSVSWIYFANIIGSTIGPLFTGFYLLDWITFETNVLLLSVITWILGLILWLSNIRFYSIKKIYKPILALTSLIAFFFFSSLFGNIFEKLLFKKEYDGHSFKYIIQNKSGVIVTDEDYYGDVVYGGGMYDGRFNTSLIVNSNSINRAYVFAAMKPDVENVLEIGLSSGSWARVLANHTGVKSLDIVEINPGYIDLISKYPEHKNILTEEKVKIHIDDGRRWITRTDKKFDFILMNTTYYWRNQINNLVSYEFIEICKNHLKEGGVMYYNTTHSPDIPYTTASVFKFTSSYGSFVAGSDKEFPVDTALKCQSLRKFYDNSKPVFDAKDTVMTRILSELASYKFLNKRDFYLKDEYRHLITDDNLASEFKTDQKPYIKNRAWYLIF